MCKNYLSKIKRRKRRYIKQEKKISRQEALDNMEKQRMLSFLYKDRITKMYNDGMSITEISKTLGVMKLTPKTVKELLVKWNIPLRYANGCYEKDMYISYVGVYDKENDRLMKVFKHKWKVIRWLKEVGIIEGNLTNSQLSYYIKKKMIIRDQVYFKKISEELYEKYKIE